MLSSRTSLEIALRLIICYRPRDAHVQHCLVLAVDQDLDLQNQTLLEKCTSILGLADLVTCCEFYTIETLI